MKIANNKSGFTIVELMIATTIFAVILLLVTAGIIAINNNFYKGVNQSNVQNTARAILDDVSQDIQFNGGTVNTPVSYPTANFSTYSICVNDIQYSVQLGYMVDDNVPDDHGLVRMPGAACDPTTTVDNFTGGGSIPSNAIEQLGSNMRVTLFTVDRVPGTAPDVYLYSVRIRLVYGADDLICSLNTSGDCTQPTTTTHFVGDDIVCKPGKGSQFCAVADLSTTVEKRVL